MQFSFKSQVYSSVKVSEYDQKMPQSHTANQPTARSEKRVPYVACAHEQVVH